LTIHLDTSLLVDALCAPFRSLDRLEAATLAGHNTVISTIALFEWLRGPRLDYELEAQGRFVPAGDAISFDAETARVAARLYRGATRARGREIDVMIAACAIEHGAALWTLNPKDFEDIPGLRLYRPSR
jgi:predicted nucleic acid-binding protein